MELLLLDPRGPELAVTDPVVFGRWLISDQRSAKSRNLALMSLDTHAWYKLFFYCARTRGQAKIKPYGSRVCSGTFRSCDD